MSAIIDPATLEWVLASDEPAARWVVLTQLLDRPPEDPDVEAAHLSVLADRGTRDLIERLGDWEDPGPLSGHDSPAYAPNLLGLLADMGVRAGDDPRVDAPAGLPSTCASATHRAAGSSPASSQSSARSEISVGIARPA